MEKREFTLMLNITKILSTELDDVKRRLIKVLRKGKSDVQTPFEASPFGIDSNPLKDMIAVYGATEEKGKSVIIGYIDKKKVAATGETRLFSTDDEGNLKFYLWLKNDGTMQIGGTSDNAVRYQKLDDGLQQFKDDIQAQLALIATGIAAAGGSYSPGVLNVDISQSKIEEVKTL